MVMSLSCVNGAHSTDDVSAMEINQVNRGCPKEGKTESSEKSLVYSATRSSSTSLLEFCRICHCGPEPDNPLLSPCKCSGSLQYVHHPCLQAWLKQKNQRHCELCTYSYNLKRKTKPFKEWEKLSMSRTERRKLICSATFHAIAITCVLWSLYVLIDRVLEEVRSGKLEWPFWTKLIVIGIGFIGGAVFMWVQCKMYIQYTCRWRAHNRVIVIQDAAVQLEAKKSEKREAALHRGESESSHDFLAPASLSSESIGTPVALEVYVDIPPSVVARQGERQSSQEGEGSSIRLNESVSELDLKQLQ